MFIPWPAAGEWVCAASPARNRCPRRYAAASRCCTRTRLDHADPADAGRQSRLVEQSLQLGFREPGTGRGRTARRGSAQGRVASSRQVAYSPRAKTNSRPGVRRRRARRPVGEVAVQLEVGEHDLRAVAAAGPADAGGPADGAVGAVAAGDPPVRASVRYPRPAQGGPRTERVASSIPTSSVPRSTGTPRSSSAWPSTVSTSSLPQQGQVREGRVGQVQPGEATGTMRRPRCSRAAGAVSARARSASTTPSGRSTSSVRGCTISAREGRNAAGRRSTTRTRAPCAWACSADRQAGRPGTDDQDVWRCGSLPRGDRPPPLPRHLSAAVAVERPRDRAAGRRAAAPAARGSGSSRGAAHQREHPPQRPGVGLGARGRRPTRRGRGRPRARRAPATASTRSPGKPTNSGVLSRLSARNAACPHPCTPRSRNSTTSTHGSRGGGRSTTVSR